MAHLNRARSHSFLFCSLAAVTLVPLALAIGACGGGNQKPSETPEPSESSASSAGESSASAPSAAESPADAGAAAPAETASAAPSAAPNPGSTKATAKNDPAFAACHQNYKPKGKDKTVGADVAALAKGCAKATKYKLVGKTVTGKQSDSGSPQTHALKAKANHCYRVYAQAGEGVKDLDVAIKDSSGAVAGEDSTDSSTAIVLDDGAVCFKEDDAANVVVSVGSGSGAYALQIWGD